eukprot:gnl/Spiro4/10429_TR5578_c0_g1_i1.p1 gnl/Spiro4/10429_TR5578_c0_g1~~gnl/Spiro4/10429_TR5578_c0_g1_i1.p1  ORF type:complete len:322 (-),score=90.69 gnl/Spiro4/10429_TR5578_c0_g1_i1:64-987(-)
MFEFLDKLAHAPLWVPCLAICEYFLAIFILKSYGKLRLDTSIVSLAEAAYHIVILLLNATVSIIMGKAAVHLLKSGNSLYCADVFSTGLNLFFFVKFLECLDAVFLVLRKKPTGTLLFWHRSSSLLLVYFVLNRQLQFAWMSCFAVSFVQIFLSWVATVRAYDLQKEIWQQSWRMVWKGRLQLLQIVVALGALASAAPWVWLDYHASQPDATPSPCGGALVDWLVFFFVWASYLVLYLDQYWRSAVLDDPTRAVLRKAKALRLEGVNSGDSDDEEELAKEESLSYGAPPASAAATGHDEISEVKKDQ